MTLREALGTANLDEVYNFINKKDHKAAGGLAPVLLKSTINSYSRVVKELLSKPRVKAYEMPWLIKESVDPFDGQKYADVCFLNTKYVAPKPGLKPWGGCVGKKVPKGYYDCNADKHNRTFASGFVPWSKLIDTPIINEARFSLEKLLAEILWELTFYGWTEEKAKESTNEIKKSLLQAKKEIADGKCITLPTPPGKFKVVIPDSVCKQIVDIANQSKKKKGSSL